MNNNNNHNDQFMFAGHEHIFSRVGLLTTLDDLQPHHYIDSLREIENLYKHKYGYKCVQAIRSKTDPLMCDVWVIPNKPNHKKIIWY